MPRPFRSSMSSVFLSRTSQAATAKAPDVGERVDDQIIEHRAGGLGAPGETLAAATPTRM